MKTTRPQNFLTLLLCVFLLNSYAQITTDSNPPYNSPIYLVDSLLLGEGVVATNHIFQGDPLQIGFFDGENSRKSSYIYLSNKVNMRSIVKVEPEKARE